MDWVNLIIALLGGTSVAGVVEAVRYRKENKALKTNEVKVSDVDAQRQEIELADLYKDKVLEMLDQVSAKQDKGNDNQDRMLDMLDALTRRVDKLEENYSNLERWANGDYHAWLAKQGE